MDHNDRLYPTTAFYQLEELQAWLDALSKTDKVSMRGGIFFHTVEEMLHRIPFMHIPVHGDSYTSDDAFTFRQPVWDLIDAVLLADAQGSKFSTMEQRAKWLRGLLSLVYKYGVFRNAVAVFKKEVTGARLSFGEGQEHSSDVVVISNDEFVGRKALETLSTLVPKLITALKEYRKRK